MNWLRTSSWHSGVQRTVIAIVLACLVTALPSLSVHVRTRHASAVHVAVSPCRIATPRSAFCATLPASVDLGEDVAQRDHTDRRVTSSRAPRVVDSRFRFAGAPAVPARSQSQILRI